MTEDNDLSREVMAIQREIQLVRQISDARILGIEATLARFESRADHSLDFEPRLSVVESRIDVFVSSVDNRFAAQKEAVKVALEAADKSIEQSLLAANKAAAKAELAAEKGYLEAQIIAVKDTFQAHISALKETVIAAIASADRAVTKAEASTEKRFESLNDFRGQLNDQQRTFVIKSEVDFRFAAIEDKLNIAVTTLSENKGKGVGLNSAWVFAVGAVSVISTVIGVIALLTTKS